MADWNPDYEAIFAQRRTRLRRLREIHVDATTGEKTTGWHHAYQYYKTHPVEAIEHWVTTYDPRNVGSDKPAYMPFVLFPKQKEYILWLWDRLEWKEDGIVDKSRDMGMTWVSVAFAWWLWTFHPGAAVSFGSRKADLVDKIGDPKSILEKFRQIMKYLPKEMRPLGWKPKDDASYMKIVNPENGSVVAGEAGTEIGRGGRSTMYFIDEAAFLEEPDRVERALSENSTCRIDVSTPNGTGNPFFRKRFSGNYEIFTFHWTNDPRKSQAWYDAKKKKLEPHVLAAEVDIDYEASAGDVSIPSVYVRGSQDLRRWLVEHDLMPEKSAGVAGLDVGGGQASSVLCPRFGPIVEKTIDWSDKDSINIASRARDEAKALNCRIIKYDSIGVGEGVTSALKRLPDIKRLAVNVGKKPTRTRWDDGKRAKDKFRNLKAELYWTVRDGCKKAYELHRHLTGEDGIKHEIQDVILLPDDPALSAEMSLPRYMKTETGLIQIESKDSMKRRGIASPDRLESLVLTYAPEKVRVESNRTTGHY